jgi:predicted GH43/DUF377 family glycosyl hydrolase
MEITKKVLLEPRDLWWERKGVFNPAVVAHNDRVYMIYRAVGSDNISRLGLAISRDGEEFQQFDEPFIDADPENPFERLGVEDPRAVKIGRDCYITYTAASVYPTSYRGEIAQSLNTPGVPWRVRVNLLKTNDFQKVEHLGTILPDLDSKNAVLFPRQIQNLYWLIHRVSPNIFISHSKDLRRFDGGMRLLGPNDSWASRKVGAACPPIEVEEGWLLIYHGVSEGKVYNIGAALLEKNNPGIILKNAEQPILKPTESWERNGFVDNVVFVTGSILDGDDLSLYYGAADRVVALAKLKLTDIMAVLT